MKNKEDEEMIIQINPSFRQKIEEFRVSINEMILKHGDVNLPLICFTEYLIWYFIANKTSKSEAIKHISGMWDDIVRAQKE